MALRAPLTLPALPTRVPTRSPVSASSSAATHAFFRLPLLESWFAGVRRLLLALRPGVLLLTRWGGWDEARRGME